MFKEGDRIRMVCMPEDPLPIPEGTLGTVVDCVRCDWPGQRFTQVAVDWDNGRKLSVVIPPDVVAKVS